MSIDVTDFGDPPVKEERGWRIECGNGSGAPVPGRHARVFHDGAELTRIRRVVVDLAMDAVAVVHLEVLAADVRINADLMHTIQRLENTALHRPSGAVARSAELLFFTEQHTGADMVIPASSITSITGEDRFGGSIIHTRLPDGDTGFHMARQAVRDLMGR